MTLSPEFIALQEALIGRYSLERELGRGGMGVVYLARDVKLDRPVAIKVMHAALASQPHARERFLHEARTAAKLSHPHIISVYSVETTRDQVFLVMAHIDGETLGARLRTRGVLPVDEAERVLREMAWALGYAHARGVIHRDITLDNVLLERGTGRALLVDFGLAGEHTASESGPRFGTPGYLAPEVIRGDAASPSSDLYALGVVAWTAMVGRAPFEAETPGQLLAKHLVQAPKALAPLVRGASRRLTGAIEACLAKEASARPVDSAELLAMLERAPEPITVAPALREWFTRWERIRLTYALVTPILTIPVLVLLWAEYNLYYGSLAGSLSPLIALLAIPIFVGVQISSELAAWRTLHSEGFNIEDIRAAFPHWYHQLVREQARDGHPPLPGRVVFDLTVIGTLLCVAAVLISPQLPGVFKNDPGVAQYYRLLIGQFGLPIASATVAGVAIGFVSPGFRLAPNGRFRRLVERFWRSHFAGTLTRFASRGQRQIPAPATTLHRNTELVLGLAIDDLWNAIPAPMREELGDIPTLAHALQRAATEMRDLSERIRASESQLVDQDDVGIRMANVTSDLDTHHRETVASLERLRLQLLRLIATRQHSTELTHQISHARELETRLMHELSGHTEVRRILNRVKMRSNRLAGTPTPTPA